MADIKGLLGQTRDYMGRQSKSRRWLMFLLIAGVVGALLYLSFGADSRRYTTLYSSLHPEDAGAIVEYLKSNNVEYKVSETTGAILAPKETAAELRMALAQMNLPMGGGVGLEYFDKPAIGMTDQVQRINYVRALQGELARSIMTISAVDRARVLLVTRDRSSFLRNQETEPSASVVLELSRGARLQPKNVEGILNLVSRSVEGLEPENIALIDARTGESLSSDYSKPEELFAQKNMEFKARYEADLERDIETMLERTIGPGRVVARVNADFDFRQTRTESTIYNNENNAMDRELVRAENVSGLKLGPSGIVGSTTALPGSPPAENTTGKQESGANNSYEVEKSYRVSQTNTTTVGDAASLDVLTVAVMVDYRDAQVQDPDSGDTETVSQPRDAQELASIENLVKRAVGFTEDKEDQIQVVVECVPFEETGGMQLADPGLEALERQEMIRLIVTWGIIGLLGALVVLFVLRPLINGLSAGAALAPVNGPSQGGAVGRSRAVLSGEHDGGYDEEDEDLEQLTDEQAAAKARKKLAGIEASTAEERAENEIINSKVQNILDGEPERAAKLIRKWLEEDPK